MLKKYPVQCFKKPLILGLVVFLCFIAAGCNFIWDASNSNSLKKDIVELTSQCKVKISKPDCNMIATSRQGYCKFTSTKKEIMALVNGLKLNKARAGLTADALVENTDMDSQYDREIWGLEQMLKPFDIFKVNDKTKIIAFLINGRPDQLHLKSGRAFEYLLLYYDAISSQACIFVCYAYG